MVSRRTFLQSSSMAALGAALPSVGAAAASSAGAATSAAVPSPQGARRALFVWGGWEGHKPATFRDIMVPVLQEEGFEVTVSDTLDAYTDESLMASLDLIMQTWTMGQISQDQANGLVNAVRAGAGMAGWHGGMGDSFRENTDYQFMVGGQWVAHPGDKLDYVVNIVDQEDPVTAGIGDFEVRNTEQYYMHVDPNNKVLATTTFSEDHGPGIAGAVMPVIWKRMYGSGRILYNAIGHNPEDFEVPQVMEIMRRGIRWAAAGRGAQPEPLVRPVYAR